MPDSNRQNGRDAKGHFAAGNPGGPGNPSVRRLAEYRQAISAAVKPEQLRRVIQKLVAKAEQGDIAAIRELLDRLVGRPQQASSYVIGGGLDFATLRTAENVTRAVESLAQAVAAGTIAPDDASRVGMVLELARSAVETGKLAAEIAELRKSIGGDV